MDTRTLVLVLAPLIVVQVAFALLALRDLLRPERTVKGGNKLVWGLVIVFGELLGPLAYFVFGRHEQER
jgi:hypothetical protein